MWNDLRYVFRTLRRSPGFTAVAILSLALGIGANTAIFSLLYQVVLRSVPVQHPESLFALESDNFNFGWTRRDNNKSVYSYPMYRELRDRNQALSGLIARASFQATLSYRGDAQATTAEVVSGNFFQVLGVRPAAGRLLLPSDDSLTQAPVAVLSYSYWAEHLGSDPAVVNSAIQMNGQPATVVGVAPREFRGMLSGQTPDFYAPISSMPVVSPGWKRTESPDAYWLSVFGRLKNGVSPQQADAMLLPLFRGILQNEIPLMKDVDVQARTHLLAKTIEVQPASQGLNQLRDQWQAPLTVLTVMVGLVLLIACTNLANLLIARATGRQREIAVRLAIGAGRWQLARQLLAESLILAAVGGVVGLMLSGALTSGLLHLLPQDAAGGWLNANLNPRVLFFSMALSLVTGLLFGLIPALQASRPNLVNALKDQGAGSGTSGAQSRIRQALVTAQVAISLLLMVGAGLFTRSLLNLTQTDPGFRADRLIEFDVDASLNGYNRERGMALFRDLQEKLRHLPGVTAVSRAEFAPFGGFGWGNGVKVPGSRHATEYSSCGENAVGTGYFSTFGIPLVAGREFTDRDDERSPKVVIINQTFAKYLFESESPIGRHMMTGAEDEDLEIVGVVKDSKYGRVREKPSNFMFIPYEQAGEDFVRRSAFFMRVAGGESGVMGAVRNTVKQIDRNLPIQRMTSMRVLLDDSIYTDRLMATLGIAFGVLATILAAIGLYGTISYSVARRTREFGIRVALGAAPGSLLLSILRETGWLVGIGIAIALPVSYALGRLVESELYGIHAHDPAVLASCTLVIVIAACAAALGPGLRAMHTEPVRALRQE